MKGSADMADKEENFAISRGCSACNGGCRSAEGEAGCADGCIGCKACIDKCKFGAISINEYGVAEVDEEKCIGCGACAKVCPQKVIHVHECANYIVVKCSNKKKGAEAKKQCDVSCIGCGICEKTCTAGAIKVKRQLCCDRGIHMSELWYVRSEMPKTRYP